MENHFPGTKDPFDLEEQYTFFLKKMGLHGQPMSPHQQRETKRAFLGGFAQCFVLLTLQLTEYEDESMVIMRTQSIKNQLENLLKTM